MSPFFLAIIAACGFAFYNTLLKLASGEMHEVVSAFILQVASAIVGGTILFYIYYSQPSSLTFTPKGAQYAILGGAVVALAEIIAIYAFSKGMSASIGIPVIVGGTIIFGAIIGIFVLQESLSLQHVAGIILVLIGIGLLAGR